MAEAPSVAAAEFVVSSMEEELLRSMMPSVPSVGSWSAILGAIGCFDLAVALYLPLCCCAVD